LLEIAIALALRPRVLLLDEPAAGVPSYETEIIHQVLGCLPADIAILIIEHDMDVVFRFAHEIVVLVQGRVLMREKPEAISADPRVRLSISAKPQDEPRHRRDRPWSRERPEAAPSCR
jgi:branched-chain amino acid transport system ATP-binding protein